MRARLLLERYVAIGVGLQRMLNRIGLDWNCIDLVGLMIFAKGMSDDVGVSRVVKVVGVEVCFLMVGCKRCARIGSGLSNSEWRVRAS